MATARRRPSALSHGLTSHYAREASSAEARVLALALLGVSPREPQLLGAAHEAAEAILHLHRVQRYRRSWLEAGTLAQLTLTGRAEDRLVALGASTKVDDEATWRRLRAETAATTRGAGKAELERSGVLALLAELADRAKELRRLEDYERRAYSARKKALRRLDYERVEAERRRQHKDRGAGKASLA